MNRQMTISQIKNEKTSYLLYFCLYCPIGILSPLIGQYLSSIGFNGTQVGITTSMGTVAAVLAGILWGKVYANSHHKRRIIAIVFFGAAAVALLTLTTKTFYIYVGLYSLLYVFQGSVFGLCDSLVMGNGRNYPIVRSWGAVGYAIAVFLVGNYAESHGLHTIFYFYSVAYIVGIVVVLRENEPPFYAKPTEKIKIAELLENKGYLKLLLCSFFVFGTSVGNSIYFGYLFREGGGDVAGIGFAFLLMAGGETIFMLLVPVINKWISTEKLTLIAVVLCALRFAYYATGPSSAMLLATFLSQGISNGIIWVEFVKYFGKIVPPRLSSIAVSTFHAVGNNFSSIVCSLVGGMLLDGFGAKGVYLFFALMNAVAAVLYICFGLQKKNSSLSS